MVDFAEVKQRVGILKVCEMLGIELKKQPNGQYRGKCPIHKGANPRGFVITPTAGQGGLWHCFGGCGGGDSIALAARVRDCSPKHAAEWIVGGTSTGTVTGEPVPGTRLTSTAAETVTKRCPVLDYLDPDHEAVAALGIERATAKEWGGGYAPKGVLRGFVAFPVKTAAGELVAYVGIGKEEMRFFSGFDRATAIFAAERVVDGMLTLVRSPLQAILAYQAGLENVVAFLTETITPQQLEQLAGLMDSKGIEALEIAF